MERTAQCQGLPVRMVRRDHKAPLVQTQPCLGPKVLPDTKVTPDSTVQMAPTVRRDHKASKELQATMEPMVLTGLRDHIGNDGPRRPWTDSGIQGVAGAGADVNRYDGADGGTARHPRRCWVTMEPMAPKDADGDPGVDDGATGPQGIQGPAGNDGAMTVPMELQGPQGIQGRLLETTV